MDEKQSIEKRVAKRVFGSTEFAIVPFIQRHWTTISAFIIGFLLGW